jgi:oligoendopeptidase F
LDLDARFGGQVDWSGLEASRESMWQRQLHLFGLPFYYIEYGIAQLGALQLWLASRRSESDAIASYKRALTLGGSRPLPELFAAAGLRFDFGPDTVRELMNAVGAELDRLPD